ncbi:GatB/YqeY domain-containing protein [Rhodocyclus purpureus]|uniref:GatB/YqeY domain-containing protein n=1 Tax=Rhodocyclus purpureus TaxID=1067 RepID=UPI0019124A72|nr:GatB/YqeY domain-containing protein [Rhodocyclus purpureus]MBK5912834.1 glutamyl-tRNA amidotransferase [Rhodocyclus purpureus]
MTLKERINEDMKTAMRARESARLAAIRLLLAAIKQKEVDERVTLDDAAVIAVIDKMLKQRRDSITQYRAAARDDLADAEQFEADLLATYLPAGLTEQEIDVAIAAAVAETGAAAAGDMGRVMTVLKAKIAGRCDMAEVSRKVKAKLAGH